MGRGWYPSSAILNNVARSRTGPEIIQYSTEKSYKLNYFYNMDQLFQASFVLYIAPDKRVYPHIFSYFSTETYVVNTH